MNAIIDIGRLILVATSYNVNEVCINKQWTLLVMRNMLEYENI